MDMIPASHKELIEDSTKAYLFLGTVMPDGFPQVTPVWFNMEGDLIQVNSAEGRVKDLNMKARPKVGLTIMSLDDPYHYLSIQGEVVEITNDGAEKHIFDLGVKYRGKGFEISEPPTRLIYKIKPLKVHAG